MGKRQDNLNGLLKQYCNSAIKTWKPTLNEYKSSNYYPELKEIYYCLGGQKTDIPTNIGKYDAFIDNTLVELDEENHFNRYRSITLDSTIYKFSSTLNLEQYKTYCNTYEENCQMRGGYWSNTSSDKLFGNSSQPGRLDTKGSSRWKQRAFYDLLKDHIPVLLAIPVKRISIYDEIPYKGKVLTVDNILSKPKPEYSDILYKHIFMKSHA
jgi:hypothetical protein